MSARIIKNYASFAFLASRSLTENKGHREKAKEYKDKLYWDRWVAYYEARIIEYANRIIECRSRNND
jgi:hypothetical protein